MLSKLKRIRESMEFYFYILNYLREVYKFFKFLRDKNYWVFKLKWLDVCLGIENIVGGTRFFCKVKVLRVFV